MTLKRIETLGRSVDLDEGVKARVADPFWMLGRQWQVGEFRGDDAGRPIQIELTTEWVPVTSFKGHGDTKPTPVNWQRGAVPLEAMAEGTAAAENGLSGRYHDCRIAEELLAQMTDHELGNVVKAFRQTFRLRDTSDGLVPGGLSGAALRVLLKRGVDGRAILNPNGPANDLVSQNAGDKTTIAEELLKTWRESHTDVQGTSWQSNRMEYGFSLAAASPDGEVVLKAGEHNGGDLDWHHFDVTTDEKESHNLGLNDAETRPHTLLPARVAYAGMPASRWWELEDRSVHMGDVQSGPADFGRLMIAEFATTYSDDWFMVPVRLKRGGLARVSKVLVRDTFNTTWGEPPQPIRHAASVDAGRVDEKNDPVPRSFHLFEMAGDGVSVAKPPGLFLAPVLGSSLTGPAVEQVELTRDEAANLAWAIERTVEGPLGKPLDRGRAWSASPERIPPAPPRTDARVGYADQSWRYRLSGECPPPWWIPLIPERVGETSETRLRRGRMREWDDHPDAPSGPYGSLLTLLNEAFYLEEEEVPRSGVTLIRRWRLARGMDGRLTLWMENRKSAGRGERSSGLAWDKIDRVVGSKDR